MNGVLYVKRGATSALVCLLMLLGNDARSLEVSQADLRAYTEWSVRNGTVSLPKPMFDWTGDYLSYQLSDVSDSFGLDRNDPISVPLTEQFTVLAIRKYRDSRRQLRFWNPVLTRVEREIAGMLTLIASGKLRGQELLSALDDRSLKISEIYQVELNQLATRNGRKGAASLSSCACYCVSLRTIPADGVIKYISAGRWSLYIFMTRELGRRDFPKPDWITVAQSECVPLTGKNWFYVRWPNGAQAKYLVKITSADTITFRPDESSAE